MHSWRAAGNQKKGKGGRRLWRNRFRGRVAVLIGPGTVSSCESFAMMMRRVPGCKLIGARTAGASGNPKPFDLGNGVTLFVPSWRDLDLDGACLEGRGLAPDIEVEADLGAFRNGHDPVLALALAFLRGGAVEGGATRRPGRMPPRP